jgi:type IV secretion system protein TrbJ
MQAEADREAQYQASHERLFDMGMPTDRAKNKGF